MRSLLHLRGPCFDSDDGMELGNCSTFCSRLSHPRFHSLVFCYDPLDLVSPTCWPLVLEFCRVSLLWLGRRLPLAASWPTSQTCRHPLRRLALHQLSQLLLLSPLSLHPPLSLDLLLPPRNKALPLLSSEVLRYKVATVASSICLCWAAWSLLLQSSLTFTGSTAKLT